jgi:hypothetical protein
MISCPVVVRYAMLCTIVSTTTLAAASNLQNCLAVVDRKRGIAGISEMSTALLLSISTNGEISLVAVDECQKLQIGLKAKLESTRSRR